ncbi:MAG: hypothetical protein ACREBH_02710 [Candidatus Micrarchaeaceae archaeon]
MEKTRSSRPRLRSRGLSLEIRCRANLLPLKALFLAIGTANKRIVKPRNSNASLYAHKLASHVRDLNTIANRLKGSADVDPDSNSNGMESAVKTYVDLFYTISKEERKGYIDSFSKGRKSKLKLERNLLIIPAMMAELKMPKEDVAKGLFYSLYKMPFKVLYDSSKSALQVALFEQNMAIRTVPYDTIESFSKSMSKLEKRIKGVEKGEISPSGDEDVKADFIDKTLEFSRATEINIADLIAEKVGTDAAVRTRMHRIMRRAKY